MVPQMTVTERSPHWPQKTITRKCRDAQAFELKSVALEQRTGRIIPYVTAATLPAPGWPAETLLIEITVTNGMDIARIRETDLPTLEIDLSRLGGKVTESEFTRLIIEEIAGKRWLHHPAIEAERGRLHAESKAVGAERPFPAPRRERTPGSSTGEGRYPSQRYAGPKDTDLWLKGEALERWKRENPESAAIWFPKKD